MSVPWGSNWSTLGPINPALTTVAIWGSAQWSSGFEAAAGGGLGGESAVAAGAPAGRLAHASVQTMTNSRHMGLISAPARAR